jgi:hypothetical protein
MTADPGTAEFICPHCGQPVAVPAGAGGEFACPHCGGTFATAPVATAPVATEPHEHEPSRDDELDGLRIRQLSSLRRATYRSRSYAVMATIVCVVATVQAAVLLTRQGMHRVGGGSTIALACIVTAGAYGTWFFARRAARLHAEATAPRPNDPHAREPDFSQLSDGSQRWKSLEQIH